MPKAEVEVQFTFTLPIDERFLQHKNEAELKQDLRKLREYQVFGRRKR